MMRLNCFINVNAENREKFLKLARCLTEASQKEDGCIGYDIFESSTNSESLLICETWRDQDALDKHSQSPHFKQYVGEMRRLAEMKTDKFL